MRSLFTAPRFTKNWYGVLFMQIGARVFPRYCVVPVGEMLMNDVSETLGEMVVLVTTSATRPSTSASRPSLVAPVGQPRRRCRLKVSVNCAATLFRPLARFTPCGSFARFRTQLLSRPSSLVHFLAAAASNVRPHFASFLSLRSSPSFTATTRAPVADPTRLVS